MLLISRLAPAYFSESIYNLSIRANAMYYVSESRCMGNLLLQLLVPNIIVHSFHFENDQTLPAFIAFKNIVRITKQCLRLHTFQAGEIKYNLQICT